jgi:hypothetical protein
MALRYDPSAPMKSHSKFCSSCPIAACASGSIPSSESARAAAELPFEIASSQEGEGDALEQLAPIAEDVIVRRHVFDTRVFWSR